MNGFTLFVDLDEESPSAGPVLAADARLDNRRELLQALRGELRAADPTDADLILAAYLRWGDRCPEHLLGDFAFVVWEPRDRKVFGARDPLGVKSLYWTRQGSRLAVGSTVRPLLDRSTTRRIDLVAVGDYLARITSEPERTFFQDLHRLAPGHVLTATPGGLRTRRYWDVGEPARRNLSEEEAAGSFLELLQESVRSRMEPAGGAVAVALSGGLDSTAVAALARRETGAVRAFSFVFPGIGECDESAHIRSFCDSLGIESSRIEAERFWFLGEEAAYRPSLESPALSWESAFRRLLAEARDWGGRVLLTGHGADDLLLGSRLAYADRLSRGDLRVLGEIWRHTRARRHGWRPFYRLLVEPRLPGDAARALRHRFGQGRPAPLPRWIRPEFADRTGLRTRLEESRRAPAGRTAFGEMYQRLIARPSYHRSVDWYDRNAEPFGIQVRHPFLDRRLFELVFSLPPSHLFRLEMRKPLLRGAVRGVVPDSIRLRRDKTTLGAFVDFSLRKEADRVRDLLADPLAEKLGIADGRAAREELESYGSGKSGKEDAERRSLWYLITLELWLRQHLQALDASPLWADAA